MLESLYRAGFNIADEQLDDDARQASFFLPYPARMVASRMAKRSALEESAITSGFQLVQARLTILSIR